MENIRSPRSLGIIQQGAWFSLIANSLCMVAAITFIAHKGYQNYYIGYDSDYIWYVDWETILATMLFFATLFAIGFGLGIRQAFSWLNVTREPSIEQLDIALRHTKNFWVYLFVVICLLVVVETIPALMRNLA